MAEVINQRSSFISSTTYYPIAEGDREAGDLVVDFNDGTSFVYHDVPRGIYTQFITAPSRGKAFHALIRDSFDWEAA